MKVEGWYNRLYKWSMSPANIAIVVFILLIIISYCTSSFGMSYDEGYWNYIGFAWLKHNIPPYTGAMDNKNPAVYLLYGIANIFFGANYWFPRILGIFSLTQSSVFVFLIGKRLYSHMAGILAMFLFGLTITWKSTGGRFTAETESFLILFNTLAFYILIDVFFVARKKSYVRCLKLFVVGLSMGAAIAFKQSAMFTAGGLLAFYVHLAVGNRFPVEKIFGDLLAILTGIILLTVVSLIPLLMSGLNLTDYYQGAWLVLFQEGSPTTVPLVARINGFIGTFKGTPIILFYPLLFLFILRGKKLTEIGIPFWGIFIWMTFDFLAVSAAGTYATHHLKVLLPSLAIASAIGLCSTFDSWLLSDSEKPKRFVQIALVIAVLWIPIYIEPIAALKKFIFPSGDADRSLILSEEPYPRLEDNDLKQVGLWIREHTGEDDLVYVAGYGASVQAYSERISPSKYFDAMFVKTPGADKQLRNDLQVKSPELILIPLNHDYEKWVPSSIRMIVEKIVQKKYRHKTCYYGYNIFEKIRTNN